MSKNTLFLDCQNYTDDKYWKQIFLNCSEGKFPPNCYFGTNNILCTTIRGKFYSLSLEQEINSKNSRLLYLRLKDFFQNTLGIQSEKDIKNKELELERINKDKKKTYAEWKNIKEKMVQKRLLDEYAMEMEKKMNLTEPQFYQLLRTLRLALSFSDYENKDIEMENNKIKNIKNLIYDEDTQLFDIVSKDKNTKASESKKKSMENNWKKYVEKSSKNIKASLKDQVSESYDEISDKYEEESFDM